MERKETGPRLGLSQWGLPRRRETPPPPNLLNWKLLLPLKMPFLFPQLTLSGE